MDTLLQDLRFSVRTLGKNRGFTALAVLCLALGIGVNTTMFSVVDSMLLRPFPFEDPDRLVALNQTQLKNGIDQGWPAYPTFLDWQREAKSFQQMAALDQRSLAISGATDDEPERVEGSAISWNYFPMLGIRPHLGRTFREDEDRFGAEPVVLLSHELWTRRYRADPSIVGKPITVNETPRVVVGVMPPRFKFPQNQEAWIPLAPMHEKSTRTNSGVQVMARLAPGVTREQADREIAAIFKRLAEQYPEPLGKWEASAHDLQKELIPDDVQLIILTMFGAVTFVLLIACANVANLMLARATARGREIAIRAALGAGRARIVRQLLTESVIVAVLAGAVGIPLAFWGLTLLDDAIPAADAIPYYIDWRMDGRAVAYTLVVSALTGIVFGLVPALRATSSNLQTTLREGGRGSGAGVRHNRLRSGLVVLEVALSVILLVGASLFVRSFVNLQRATGGIDSSPLMTMRFYLPGDSYDSLTARALRVEDVVRRVEALPGVVAATGSVTIPLGGGGLGSNVLIDGRAVEKGEEPNIFWTAVTGHWTKTVGMQLVAGRDLTEGEAADSSPVAVINQTFAKQIFPNEPAVGRRFRFANDTAAPWITIVGVAADISVGGIDSRMRPQAFLPLRYFVSRNTGLTIRVAAGSPASVVAGVRRELRSSDPKIPIFEVQTMDELKALGFWENRLFGWMFSIFGGIALLLAAIGVYGVIAYGVSQRTQEIGVRVALGAGRRDVLRLIIGQGVLLAAVGVAFGIAGAFGVTRVVTSILYNVSPSDPLSFVGVSLFLTSVAVAASYIPARKAMGVDPLIALKHE